MRASGIGEADARRSRVRAEEAARHSTSKSLEIHILLKALLSLLIFALAPHFLSENQLIAWIEIKLLTLDSCCFSDFLVIEDPILVETELGLEKREDRIKCNFALMIVDVQGNGIPARFHLLALDKFIDVCTNWLIIQNL